jgi:hypothetical protein
MFYIYPELFIIVFYIKMFDYVLSIKLATIELNIVAFIRDIFASADEYIKLASSTSYISL